MEGTRVKVLNFQSLISPSTLWCHVAQFSAFEGLKHQKAWNKANPRLALEQRKGQTHLRFGSKPSKIAGHSVPSTHCPQPNNNSVWLTFYSLGALAWRQPVGQAAICKAGFPTLLLPTCSPDKAHHLYYKLESGSGISKAWEGKCHMSPWGVALEKRLRDGTRPPPDMSRLCSLLFLLLSSLILPFSISSQALRLLPGFLRALTGE